MSNLDNSVSVYNKKFIYDYDNEIMLNYYPKRVAEKLVTGSFLELGLGHGYTINEFLKHVKGYTVLEGSRAIIDNFKIKQSELYRKVDVIETYFETFETNKKYDNIVMGFILEHVDNPREILEKYKNMLTAKGKIFIAVPNAESLHRQIGLHAGYMDDLKSLSKYDILQGHKRYYDKNSLLNLAKESQLRVLSIEGIFLKPLTTSQLKSLDLAEEIICGMLEMGKKYPELSNGILMELAAD